MKHRCVEPLELAAWLALPDDDPRRREAAGCARCDSLLRAGAAFVDGDAALPQSERVHAEQYLAGALAAEIGRQSATVGAAQGRPGDGNGTSGGRPRRRQQWGWGLGLAAALACVMVFVVREPETAHGPSGVLRGGAPVAGAAADLTVTATADAATGLVRLSWPAVTGADRYQVELYAANLDTLAVLGPLTEPAVTVEAATLRAGGDEAKILCRVRALGAAGQVGVSPLRGLNKP